jgi:hypothetical protein
MPASKTALAFGAFERDELVLCETTTEKKDQDPTREIDEHSFDETVAPRNRNLLWMLVFGACGRQDSFSDYVSSRDDRIMITASRMNRLPTLIARGSGTGHKKMLGSCYGVSFTTSLALNDFLKILLQQTTSDTLEILCQSDFHALPLSERQANSNLFH